MWTLPLLNLIPIKLRLGVIFALLLAAASALAFGSGYLIAQKTDAEHATTAARKEGDKKVADINKFNDAEKTRRVEVKVRDVAREQQLTRQLEAARSQRDALQKILHEKPDLDPNVHLRVGDVRLLNDAAKGTDPKTTGVSDPARLAAYQEQSPSTVTQRYFNDVELGIRFQYNELAARNDKLIDWVNEELIKPQLGDPK